MLEIKLAEKKKYTFLIFFSLMLFLSVSSIAQTPVLFFQPIISSGLSSSLDIVNAGDGSNRLFIAQQDGKVRYIRGSVLIDTIFLNIGSLISSDGERGLLSIAFHPQYKTNGYFFVYYTDVAGALTLARYQVSSDANLADALSGQVLLTVPHSEFGNHNGGKLNFGIDGNLYLAFGDGGSGGDPHFNSQNGDMLLGKMIRINVDNFATVAPFYLIPTGNPYTIPGDNIKDEIWAFGLRNPFRWSFDRLAHDMWIGDVGQNRREEIDFRPAASTGGVNYGWRCYEGNLSYNDSGCLAASNYISPVFDYDRTATGGVTVTGGMVYRGATYPLLYGWYICIDFYSTNGWLIQPDGSNWTVKRQSGLPTNVAAFGEDENGELYAVSITGIIYQVQATMVLPVKLQSFTVAIKEGEHQLRWKTASEQNLQRFEIEISTDGISFKTIGQVPATNTDRPMSYQFDYRLPGTGKIFYRLKIFDNTGKAEYSSILKMEDNTKLFSIAPTLIQNNRLSIQLNKSFSGLQVIDMNGRIVRKKSLDQTVGMIYLDVTGLSKGVYTIRLIGDGSPLFKKVVIQ